MHIFSYYLLWVGRNKDTWSTLAMMILSNRRPVIFVEETTPSKATQWNILNIALHLHAPSVNECVKIDYLFFLHPCALLFLFLLLLEGISLHLIQQSILALL